MSSDIQIYYLYSPHLQKSLNIMNVDLSVNFRKGDKTPDSLNSEIKTNPKFCRNEESIRFKHLQDLIYNDVILYAELNGKVVGVLTFIPTIKNNNRTIIFNGICSPIEYSKLGIGKELIETLIRLAKLYNFKFIKLDCQGSIMNYYKNKFGFQVTGQHSAYDSDDDSDDEGSSEIYYEMMLDVDSVSGGKKSRKRKLRTSKKSIKKRKRSRSIKKRKY